TDSPGGSPHQSVRIWKRGGVGAEKWHGYQTHGERRRQLSRRQRSQDSLRARKSAGSGSHSGTVAGGGMRGVATDGGGPDCESARRYRPAMPIVIPEKKASPVTRRGLRVERSVALEREPGDQLSGARLRARSVEGVDKPIAAIQRSAGRTRNRKWVVVAWRISSTGAAAGGRWRVEHAIKHVLELCPNLDVVLLFNPEVSRHAERFSRLPLPPVVDVVRSRDPELARTRFRKCIRIQHHRFGRVEVRIWIEPRGEE